MYYCKYTKKEKKIFFQTVDQSNDHFFSGIACFQCSSNSSFTDCEAQQVVVNCSFPQQYCFKERNLTQDDNEQAAVFYKGCTSADRCTKEKKDSVECCENNLCNKGKRKSGFCPWLVQGWIPKVPDMTRGPKRQMLMVHLDGKF